MLKSKMVSLLAVALIMGSSALVAQAQVVVTADDPQGWFERASNTGTVGLGIADNHTGTGSLLLSTDGTVGQIVKAARVPIPLITVADITTVSWDVYTSEAGFYPRPNIEYWSPARAGTLVMEVTEFVPTVNTWANVVVTGSTMFRDTNSQTVDTLANWQAGPVGGIPVNFFQLGFGSTGGTFPATTAYMDYVELNGTTWDFEDVTVLPPEPPVPSQNAIPTLSQWGMMTLFMLLGLVAFLKRKHFV